MRVEELMSEARCCQEGTSVRDCARMMRDESIGFVPICNGRGEPVGAITDRDLTIRVLAEGISADERVERFMTRDVVACRTGDDVKEVARLMRDERRSRVMACDEKGKIRGVVSLADLAEVESEGSMGETLQQVKSDQPTAH
jgi:CBS domain-containing protein